MLHIRNMNSRNLFTHDPAVDDIKRIQKKLMGTLDA